MTSLKPVAPVVLFTYNRFDHTKRTIHALSENLLASSTDLIIYSDGPKAEDGDIQKVKTVRNYLKKVDGFRSVRIIEQKENKGLATSIINGVTEVVNSYGKAIVLEDDIVTSQAFLTFMNSALEHFKPKKRVWHISGWNYPIDPTGLPDTFLWRVMNCWGWATWADRWKFYKRDTDALISTFTKKDILKFNVDGHEDFWGQVLSNSQGIINTWAIYWYATIFVNNGLCLNPTLSYTKNIGLDGSGIHCGKDPGLNRQHLNSKTDPKFPKILEEDKEALKAIKEFFSSRRRPFLSRVINRLSKILKQGVRP